MSAWAVVVAAGRGARSGLSENKVYFEWNGRSVLGRCLDALSESGALAGIVLVISEEDLPLYRAMCDREGEPKQVRRIVYGGANRQESVFNGLSALPEDADWVAIHDAARPFVTSRILLETLHAAKVYGSGVISTPVTDTIKRVKDGSVETLPRDQLRAVQTPQCFRTSDILEAHRLAIAERWIATDDAALYERYVGGVHLVETPDSGLNRKLTTAEDFAGLSGSPMRVGSGYDAHRLAQGRKLVLCGVEVPHDRGLDGHSDADVAVHALMDALLGALGEGDIGRHFPDSDEAYRGISSMILLEKVMEIVRAHGFEVVNADVTIVAQRPKLKDLLPEMAENLREALATPAVNVKATTTEHMGFEGEETGISSQAVVLLHRRGA